MPTDTAPLATLTDLVTLERTLKDGGVDTLLAALDDALARTPAQARLSLPDGPRVGPRTLRILRSALRFDADFLREHPEALFQCLYNRLRWFDAPDAARHYPSGAKGAWTHPEAHLFQLAERWRKERESSGSAPWLESLLPLRGELDSTDQVLPHDGRVLCAAYSPSGDRLVTGSWEDGRNVSIWDMTTGERLQVMAGHEAEVRGVAWSPDGTKVASGSRDHDACIWDARTGERLHALTGQEGQVTSVAFSPDGRTLAAANLGWRVRLVDVESGRVVRTLEGHQQSVLCVAFHPSGRWLASGASDNTVRVWDVETGAVVAVLPNQTHVRAIDFSPDGRWLALTVLDGIARADTRDWKQTSLRGGDVMYSHVAWLGDSRLGVLTFNRVEVLDARTGEVLLTRPYRPDLHERGVAFHPEGQRYALTARDGRVRVNDLDAEVPPSLLAEEDEVQDLWAPPEGTPVAIVRRARSCAAIDAGGHVRAFPADPAESFKQPWAIQPGGARAAYATNPTPETSMSPGVRLLDLASLTPERLLAVPPKPESDEYVYLSSQPIAFSPDGRHLAAAVEPGAARLWRVSDGTLLHTLRGLEGTLNLVAFTPDGEHLVTASVESSRLQVHAIASGERVIDTEAITEPEVTWAVAEDVPRLVVGRESGVLEVFDLPGGPRRVIPVSNAPVIHVSLSADGARVASCCMDEVVRVHDTRTGKLLHTWPHPSLPFDVALGDGLAVTRAQDSRMRVFDLETGALREQLSGTAEPGAMLDSLLWDEMGDGPVAFHRKQDLRPLVHFHDTMEELLTLGEGLVVGRGRTEKDFLYVLKLRNAD
jgi:WD40 repeat protein